MRYEFKKLFSSKLMWFVLLLTAAYMVFLPLREVWGSMAQTRESAESFEAVLDDVNTGGLTQEELAKRVGVSQPAIAQYERGTATPRLFVTIRLATALSVSIEDLIGKEANDA